ncbi:MAG: DUF4412 domain-containing protein [Myxococcales bacterium]|nr:DUF4412 domain-containing protein [Myxococcales bacterium]
MRRWNHCWAAGVWMLALPAAATEVGTYIEQEITQSAVGKQPAMTGVQKIWIGKDRIRNETELADETSVAIFDFAAARVIMMPTDDKQYLEMKLDDYRRLVSMRLKSAGLSDPKAEPRLSETGEEKTVGEYRCRKVIFEQGGRSPVRMELWLTRDAPVDFGFFLDVMKKLGLDQSLGKIGELSAKLDGYPIEVVSEQTIEKQTIRTSSKVRRIASGPLDPALFRIPEGYKKLSGDITR